MAWLLPLILVLCSAGLHAGWNLIVKGGGIAWLGVSARRSSASLAGLAWAVATAVFIASYSIASRPTFSS
ncbi:MAG TPA: hypothetical protein VF579_14470 [Candidatus Methylomirabilis sp.]